MPKLDDAKKLSVSNDIDYEKFFYINFDLLFIANLEGTFLKLNPAWTEVLGYETIELEGHNYIDYIHPEDIENSLYSLSELRKKDNSYPIYITNRYKSKNNTFIYLKWRIYIYDNLIYASARKITDGKTSLAKTIDDIYIPRENNSKIQPENLQLLLVEDNEMNQNLVHTMLRYNNINCDITSNGSLALSAFANKHYDIILMDCQMPIMDGYETTKKIRELEGTGKHTIIIAMTANAMQGDREYCINSGMDDYISKPVNFEVLLDMIHRYTNKNNLNNKTFDNSNLIEDTLKKFIENTGLDYNIAKQIVMDYIKSFPALKDKLKDLLTNNDFANLKKTAHQIKGTSANLRITKLHQLALELENAAKIPDKNECEKIINKIIVLFEAV